MKQFHITNVIQPIEMICKQIILSRVNLWRFPCECWVFMMFKQNNWTVAQEIIDSFVDELTHHFHDSIEHIGLATNDQDLNIHPLQRLPRLAPILDSPAHEMYAIGQCFQPGHEQEFQLWVTLWHYSCRKTNGPFLVTNDLFKFARKIKSFELFLRNEIFVIFRTF